MSVRDARIERPLLEAGGDAYVAALASPDFYELASSAPLAVVADLSVEWDGSLDLVLSWDEIQRLIDQLLLAWIEVAKGGIANASLTLTWPELENLAPMVFTWTELPAELLDAYELDPQRPYGRITRGT